MKKKLIIIIAAALVVLLLAAAAVWFFFLRGKGEEEEAMVEEVEITPVPAPVTYSLKGDSVIALPVGADTLVYVEETEEATVGDEAEATAEPEETAEAEKTAEPESKDGEESSEETEPAPTAYRYEGLLDVNGLVSAYANLLSQTDTGFTIVDDELAEMLILPNFWANTGAVRLVRKMDTGMLFSVHISWEGSNCIVDLEELEPPPEPTPEPKKASTGFTLEQAVDNIKSVDPSDLGLSGSSMDGYNVYTQSGLVYVNDTPCLQVNIYSTDESAGTNEIEGRYYLSNDGLHLYVIRENGGEIEEIPIPWEEDSE